LAALDQTIVVTALPAIAIEFSAINEIAWVGTAYFLTAVRNKIHANKIFRNVG